MDLVGVIEGFCVWTGGGGLIGIKFRCDVRFVEIKIMQASVQIDLKI